MPLTMTARFRYAVVFLTVTAYVLIAAAFLYGYRQQHQSERLLCSVAAAQGTTLRVALAQPGQDARLQAGRRQVLASWRALSRDYGCLPHAAVPGTAAP